MTGTIPGTRRVKTSCVKCTPGPAVISAPYWARTTTSRTKITSIWRVAASAAVNQRKRKPAPKGRLSDSVRAVAAVPGDLAIGGVVRAAEELAVTGILVEEPLHPGNPEATEHIVVQAAAIGAEVGAVVDFYKGLLDAVRQAIVEGRSMCRHRRDDIGLTGEDQGRCLRTPGIGADGIPGRQRNGCLDTALTGHAQRTTAAHGPTDHTQTIGVDHPAHRAGTTAVLADQIVQRIVDLTGAARRLVETGVRLDGHHYETVGCQLGTPPVNGRLGRNEARDHHNRRHGAFHTGRVMNGTAAEAADQTRYAAGTGAVGTAACFKERDGRIRTTGVGGITTRGRICRRVGGEGRRGHQQCPCRDHGKQRFREDVIDHCYSRKLLFDLLLLTHPVDVPEENYHQQHRSIEIEIMRVNNNKASSPG